MDINQLRLDLIAVRYENGRQSSDDLLSLIDADERGLGYDVIEAALQGLVDANKVRAESTEDDRLWSVTGQGRLYLDQVRG